MLSSHNLRNTGSIFISFYTGGSRKKLTLELEIWCQ